MPKRNDYLSSSKNVTSVTTDVTNRTIGRYKHSTTKSEHMNETT